MTSPRRASLARADQAQYLVYTPPAIQEGVAQRLTINNAVAAGSAWPINGTFTTNGLTVPGGTPTTRRHLAYPSQLSFGFVTTGGTVGTNNADTIGSVFVRGINFLGREVSETVTVNDLAVSIYRTRHVYKRVDSIQLTYTSGGTPATDEVLVGVGLLGTGTSNQLAVPVPLRLAAVEYMMDCFPVNLGGATATNLTVNLQAPVAAALANTRRLAFDPETNTFRVVTNSPTQPTTHMQWAVSVDVTAEPYL